MPRSSIILQISVILLCVRWYLAHSLSLCDLKEVIAGRGLTIDFSRPRRPTDNGCAESFNAIVRME